MISALSAEGTAVTLICPRNYQFREQLSSNPLVTLAFTRARSTGTKRGVIAKLWQNCCFLGSSAFSILQTVNAGDVVHFQHVLYFPFAAIFFAAAHIRKSRIVFTVHDPVPHKWLLPEWLRWLDRGLLVWAYRVCDTVIVHSEPGKRALMEHFGLDPSKIRVIGRGPYGLGGGVIPLPDSKNLEILLFGSIRENKGVHLAIEAVQSLFHSGTAVRLTIAGDIQNGNQARYWEECCRLIAQDPEPIQVLKTFIPDERLPALFAGCHCVLLPYTTFFSDSGVAFMAMANGRTIVATRAGGLGPLLDSAKVGVAIQEPTARGVAAAITEVVRLGKGELARQAEAGAEYVNIQCGWQKFAKQTSEIYAMFNRQ
jgi:glycosyltransferase involved in cell wall biosynthesis